VSAIGPRQRAAIARIEFMQPNGQFGQGTGFAVARNRILTAWHVLEAGTEHKAVFGGDRTAVALGARRSAKASQKKQDDWVLVECQVPDDIEPIELAEQWVKEEAKEWRSRTFPIDAPAAGYFGGPIVSWDGNGLLDLGLDASAPNVDPGGASGAPVFVSERAVGILVATRGKSGGLTAIDADHILSMWPAGETKPAPVTARVPYELWVRQVLAPWLKDNAPARLLAAKLLEIDDLSRVTEERLARVLMTSTPENALDFVKRTISGQEQGKLLDLSCSLWVHPGAAWALGENAFVGKKLAVLCCASPAAIDHVCVAEGLVELGYPRAIRSEERLTLTYQFGEPAKDALWQQVRQAHLGADDTADVSDKLVASEVNESYVVIAVEKAPPIAAVDGLRDKGVTRPVIAFSKQATPAGVANTGGVFIEPYPDPDQEQRASRRWQKRRSG
jgi:hypothetical protein